MSPEKFTVEGKIAIVTGGSARIAQVLAAEVFLAEPCGPYTSGLFLRFRAVEIGPVKSEGRLLHAVTPGELVSPPGASGPEMVSLGITSAG